MDKFPALNVYRGIYLLLGWMLIVGGCLFAYELSSPQQFGNRAPTNWTTFVIIAGAAIFFGGTMIVLAEAINVLLRIEEHLDIIRKSNQNQPQLPINTTQVHPVSKNLDLNPIPDDD